MTQTDTSRSRARWDAAGAHASRAMAAQDRHGRRWSLQLPDDCTTTEAARPLLFVMGLPTFGLAFAITILTTYGPVVLLPVAHSAARVGYLIGGEGAFALLVPLLSGAVSDRLPDTGAGRRAPFVLAGIAVATPGLVLVPLLHSYLLAGFAVLLFFVGYYLYYPPYRALYADVLPRRLFARAQASQAVLRGAGLGVALLTGGLLLRVGSAFPFALSAVMLLVTTVALVPVVRLQRKARGRTLDYQAAGVRDLLLRNRSMVLFAVANALWELSFAGLKTFIVLFVVRGLGHSTTVASAVIAVVAVAYVVGAPLAAKLADRYGMSRVMFWSGLVFGIGLCCGALPIGLGPLLAFLPVTALGGAILLTLPQALAFTLAPDGGQGSAAGIVDVSRGVGVVLGPILVGVAVSATSGGVFASTHGYAAMWPVIGVAVLASLPLLRLIRQARLRAAAGGSTAR